MGKYSVFASSELMKVFISLRCDLIKELGDGAEGACYLGTDRNVYKIYYRDRNSFIKPEDVITKDELDLPSFLFPKELFVVDGYVRGHVTDYFPGNQFGFCRGITNYFRLDYEALASAYDAFLQDIHTLSEQGIYTFELCFNLMFNGERLVACDTCEYKRLTEFDFETLYKTNVANLDYAIDQELLIKSECGDIEYREGDFKRYYNQKRKKQ